MAPLGHTVLQAPQPTHRCGLDDHAAARARRAPGAGGAPAGRGLPVVLALARRVAADGARRADVDAGAAADLLVAAVGAQLGVVAEEARLLELAGQFAQRQHGGASARSSPRPAWK
jgi:hypothetical protein